MVMGGNNGAEGMTEGVVWGQHAIGTVAGYGRDQEAWGRAVAGIVREEDGVRLLALWGKSDGM